MNITEGPHPGWSSLHAAPPLVMFDFCISPSLTVCHVSVRQTESSDSSALTLQISASASILCLIAFAIDAGVVGIQKTGHDDTDGLVTLTWGNGVSTRTQRHRAVTYFVDPPFG